MAHKLSIQERQNIINVINEMRFAHLPPTQVVAILAEEGNYIGSEMTIYRIMREEGLLNHRGRARQMKKKTRGANVRSKGNKTSAGMGYNAAAKPHYRPILVPLDGYGCVE